MNSPRELLTDRMWKAGPYVTKSEEIADICKHFKNEISFLKEPKENYPYTCMQYCVQCTTASTEKYNAYMKLSELGVKSIDMIFLKWLMSSSYIVKSQKNDCSFVTYWSSLEPQHIGFLLGDYVVSKWGRGGPLVQHSIFDIPSSYGAIAKWYRWSGEFNIIDLISEFLDCLDHQGKI